MSAQPTAPHGPGRVDRTERALVRLHALILVALGAFSLVAAGSAGDMPLLVGVSGALWLLVGADLMRRGEHVVHLVALFTALASGSLAQAEVATGALPAGLAVGVLGLSAARLLRGPGFALVMLTAAATSVGITAVVHRSALTTTIDDAVLSVSMTVAIRGLLRAVGNAAAGREAADRDLASARRAEAAATAEREATERANRALHDQVLTALRGISSGWPADVVRRDAATAVHAVRAAAEPPTAATAPTLSGLDDFVRAMADVAPLHLDVDITGDPRWGSLEPPQMDALARATSEALRNVHRHSGTHAATLRLTVAPKGLEVEVIDHGDGRADAIVPGFGLRSSIIEPVQRVGGTVHHRETPGGGITVAISAPRTTARRGGVLETSYRDVMSASLGQSPVTGLVLPIAVAYSYIAVRNSWSWDVPARSVLVLAGLNLVLAVIVHRLRVRPPRLGWLCAVVGSLIALTALGLAAAPAGAMLDFRGWPVGYAAVVVSMLLLVVPVWSGLALLAPLPLLVVVAQRLDPSLSDGAAPWSAVNAALMLPLGLLAVGVALRRVGHRVEADQQEAARLWLTDAARRATSRVSDVQLAHTRRRVLPWLESVAEGVVDVDDPAVPRTATTLAMEVRDDL